jgi:hypothetical protein
LNYLLAKAVNDSPAIGTQWFIIQTSSFDFYNGKSNKCAKSVVTAAAAHFTEGMSRKKERVVTSLTRLRRVPGTRDSQGIDQRMIMEMEHCRIAVAENDDLKMLSDEITILWR